MFFHKQHTISEQLAGTIFFTSLVSYIVFWILDALRPGFVSRYLSVHLFLLMGILSGAWFGSAVSSWKERSWLSYVFCCFFSILVGILCWIVGVDLGILRVWLVLFGLLTPWIFYLLIRRVS